MSRFFPEVFSPDVLVQLTNKLSSELSIDLPQGQEVVAGMLGFDSWSAVQEASAEAQVSSSPSAAFGREKPLRVFSWLSRQNHQLLLFKVLASHVRMEATIVEAVEQAGIALGTSEEAQEFFAYLAQPASRVEELVDRLAEALGAFDPEMASYLLICSRVGTVGDALYRVSGSYQAKAKREKQSSIWDSLGTLSSAVSRHL